MNIRPVVWTADIPALCALDTSFATDRIYAVDRQPLAFTLTEREISPLTKTVCNLADEIEHLQQMPHVVVAEVNGEIAGLAAASCTAWNGRAVLWHLYVHPSCRGRGVGTALIQSALAYARSAGAWCLWLETPNVNGPAVRFYRKCGFTLCGLDVDLYHPAGPGKNETALYFSLPIT